MKKWQRVKSLDYSEIQKKLDTFVEKVKSLQQRVEDETEKMAELTKLTKGAE